MSEEFYFERRRTTFDVSLPSNNQILQQKKPAIWRKPSIVTILFTRMRSDHSENVQQTTMCTFPPSLFFFFLHSSFLINIVKSFCLYARCFVFFSFLFKCLQLFLFHEVRNLVYRSREYRNFFDVVPCVFSCLIHD